MTPIDKLSYIVSALGPPARPDAPPMCQGQFAWPANYDDDRAIMRQLQFLGECGYSWHPDPCCPIETGIFFWKSSDDECPVAKAILDS